MKRLYRVLFFCIILLILGACNKKEEVKENTFSEKDILEKENSRTFSGETIIESQSNTEKGFYLSWYDDTDTLLVGFLEDKFVTEYNYPEGTKVKIEAISDGNVTTNSGKEAYKIIFIEYIEDIPVVEGEEFEEEFSLEEEEIQIFSVEGTGYVEEQFEENGETYIVFSLEESPNFYYYGKIDNHSTNMKNNNYYFYINYNVNEFQNDMQYCEVVSWEEYSYNIPSYVDTDSPEIQELHPQIKESYDAAFYSEETGIWLVGNTTSNGKPFILSGIEELYIEDGYLYFIGKIDNLSDKDYALEVRVSVKDKDGNVLNQVDIYNDVFTYTNSEKLERKEVGSWLTGNDLKVRAYILANETSFFTVASGGIFPDMIPDTLNIRAWNREPYYIYVTVSDYIDLWYNPRN